MFTLDGACSQRSRCGASSRAEVAEQGRSELNHHFDTLCAIAITNRILFLLLDRRESWLLHDCPSFCCVEFGRGARIHVAVLSLPKSANQQFAKFATQNAMAFVIRRIVLCPMLLCVPAATDMWSRCTFYSVRASQTDDVHRRREPCQSRKEAFSHCGPIFTTRPPRPTAIWFLVLPSSRVRNVISAAIARRFEHSSASTSTKTSQEQQQPT
jgi:hypothetical protein